MIVGVDNLLMSAYHTLPIPYHSDNIFLGRSLKYAKEECDWQDFLCNTHYWAWIPPESSTYLIRTRSIPYILPKLVLLTKHTYLALQTSSTLIFTEGIRASRNNILHRHRSCKWWYFTSHEIHLSEKFYQKNYKHRFWFFKNFYVSCLFPPIRHSTR